MEKPLHSAKKTKITGNTNQSRLSNDQTQHGRVVFADSPADSHMLTKSQVLQGNLMQFRWHLVQIIIALVIQVVEIKVREIKLNYRVSWYSRDFV